MMDNVILYSKLASLPANLKAEVSDFIDVLVGKAKKNKDIPSMPKPTFGSGKGIFKVSPDFDEPLEDFKDYMS